MNRSNTYTLACALKSTLILFYHDIDNHDMHGSKSILILFYHNIDNHDMHGSKSI